MAGSGTPGILCSAGNTECPCSERPQRPDPEHPELLHACPEPAPSYSRDKASLSPTPARSTNPWNDASVHWRHRSRAGQQENRWKSQIRSQKKKKPDGASEGAPGALSYLPIPSLRTSPKFSPASRDRPREPLPPPSRRSDPGGIGDVPDTPGALGAAPSAAAGAAGNAPGSWERRQERE